MQKLLDYAFIYAALLYLAGVLALALVLALLARTRTGRGGW